MTISTWVSADAVSDAISAAKAASEAATAALAAAESASAPGGVEQAAAAAMQAAKAANEAAAAAVKAAEAAKQAQAAAPQSESPSTDKAAKSEPAVGAKASADSGSYDSHVNCDSKPCQVDLYLTRGFRAFSQCQVCHGLDGTGSTIAPSLMEKMKEIGKAQFDEVVTNGEKGQIGVMPGWKSNPNVMKYLDHLYLYLLARADGVLPAGKLKRYDR